MEGNMNWSVFRVVSVCSGLLFVASASAVEIWATDNLGTNNAATVGDRIIRFDSANPTGTVLTVGATGVANVGMTGLDFSGAGVLYAASGFGSAFTTSQLF